MCGVLGDAMPMPRIVAGVQLVMNGAGPGFRLVAIKVSTASVTANDSYLVLTVPDDEVWVVERVELTHATGTYVMGEVHINDREGNAMSFDNDTPADAVYHNYTPPVEMQQGWTLGFKVTSFSVNGTTTGKVLVAQYQAPDIG